ncbi:hypothetical protein CONPUDRAFT_107924 [Coniophora puteana RWD-64-598 SS2]|uniref:Uncharacterized protein n=1 Tax=Coniophora puteana (strain RWD-64-598) TaxID=741705 RepID=A0A5M3MHR6_CONPW|nr:uncharacterized protein CONPUDRAFT_107924 [Coniophora puteana RWD-64-598 SS2]EIW78171.1 hypothetical protein CONPUDRAFT_107924 [Coniophora puteana RWD-64-598 SS2]
MYIPFVAPKLDALTRRKGGGGGGSRGGGSSGGSKGGGSSSSGGSKGGGSSSGSGSKGGGSTGSSGGGSAGKGGGVTGSSGGSGSRPAPPPVTIKSGPASGRSMSVYGNGGGKAVSIPSGQMFSGRSAGGGTRAQVVGTRSYGSGYPGVSGRGVTSRGFPFWFWPVVWGGSLGAGGDYLIDHEALIEDKYGDSFNSSRMGGPMMEATFQSNDTITTLHFLADNSTVTSVIPLIFSNCSSYLNSNGSSQMPVPFNSSDPFSPQPYQVVQYYRSSSAVLTLDGYNNSATLSSDENAPDTPIPSWVNATLMDCVNQTLVQAMPLVDSENTAPTYYNGGSVRWDMSSSQGLMGLALVASCLVSLF